MTLTAELRTQALRCAAAVEPEVMTGAQAAAAVADLATVEKAAATARMFLALRVAKTNAWQGQGHKTAADWLAGQLGISVWEANKQLGTARRANDLPKTKKKMQDGELSPDQADAVADAATADPAAEDDLLDLAARETTKNLRDEAAKRKAAATDDGARERRIHRERSKRTWVDRDGAWNLRLREPPQTGFGSKKRCGRSPRKRSDLDGRTGCATRSTTASTTPSWRCAGSVPSAARTCSPSLPLAQRPRPRPRRRRQGRSQVGRT